MLWGLGVLPLALALLAAWLAPLILDHVERRKCVDAAGQVSQETGKCAPPPRAPSQE